MYMLIIYRQLLTLKKFDATVAIGKNITKVNTFGVIYNAERGLKKMARNLIIYLKMVKNLILEI